VDLKQEIPVMTYKLIVALALSLGLGTAALAQTTDNNQPDTSGGTLLPGNTGNAPVRPAWDAAINDAFYVDAEAGTLRTEDEIRTNWGSLSADQQAMVRTDCDATTASVEAKPGEASPDADARSSMIELCDMVGDM
jgi:predicted Fe-S protein YdhL (DUF1289 family)